MTRIVAGALLCYAGPFGFMACGAPSEEESVGSVAEPAVLLKPPKHFSGEPEYPVEGGPPKLDLPPPWDDRTNQQGPEKEPYEPPTYEPPEQPPVEPPPEMPVPGENSPREGYNPHHSSESRHSSILHGGPDAGDGIGHHGHMETSRGSSSSGDKYTTRMSPQQWKNICTFGCAVLAGAGCASVGFSCVAGAVWSFGGILIPCAWAATAACGAAAGISVTCAIKCNGG